MFIYCYTRILSTSVLLAINKHQSEGYVLMGLKNWTVTADSIQKSDAGLISFTKYLEDKNHKNHKDKTESIMPIFGNAKNLAYTQCKRASDKNLEMRLKRKGGRPVTTFAQSFVLSLPQGVRPTQQQWKEMIANVIKFSATVIDENIQELMKDTFINVHDNKSNPHLNLLIGKIDSAGRIRKPVTQKKFLTAIKTSFNAAVLKTMGVDYATYTPERSGYPSMEKWEYMKTLAEEAEKNAKKAVLEASSTSKELEAKAQELTEEILDAEATLENMGEIIETFKPAEAEALAEIMRPRPKSKRELEAKAEQGYETERDRYQGNDYSPGGR